jgi:hypothetical protein
VVQFDVTIPNLAIVRNYGVSTVTYQRGASTFTTLQSAKVADVSVHVGSQVLTNVVVDSAPKLMVKLNFLSSEGRPFTDLRDCEDEAKFVQQIKFQCFISKENTQFIASPSFDPATGNHFCIVEPYQTKAAEYDMEEQLALIVVASDAAASYQLKKLVPINYISAFQVRPQNVELSPRSRRGKFQVLSKTSNSIVFSPELDPTVQCEIKDKNEKCDFGTVVVFLSSSSSHDAVFYEIYTKDSNSDEAIMVRSALTGQQERVTFYIGSTVPVTEVLEETETYVVLSDDEEQTDVIPIIIVLLVIIMSMYVILVCARRQPEQGSKFIPIEPSDSAFAPQVEDSHVRSPRKVAHTMNETFSASTRLNRTGFAPISSNRMPQPSLSTTANF